MSGNKNVPFGAFRFGLDSRQGGAIMQPEFGHDTRHEFTEQARLTYLQREQTELASELPPIFSERLAALDRSFTTNGALTDDQHHELLVLSLFLWDVRMKVQFACAQCKADRTKYGLPEVACLPELRPFH